MDDIYDSNVLNRHQVPRHRLTIRDYHRLGEAGVLAEDDRIELLQGQLVDMSAIGPRHALAVDALTDLLYGSRRPSRGAGTEPDRYLGTATGLYFGTEALAEVFRRPSRPPDAYLLIEVADSSPELDLRAKLELYARPGFANSGWWT
jgi:hypothetical protein